MKNDGESGKEEKEKENKERFIKKIIPNEQNIQKEGEYIYNI